MDLLRLPVTKHGHVFILMSSNLLENLRKFWHEVSFSANFFAVFSATLSVKLVNSQPHTNPNKQNVNNEIYHRGFMVFRGNYATTINAVYSIN